jgi:predicted dehydrogenase
LKVLVVGLGGIGQRHVRNLRSLTGDDLQLTAYRVRRTTPLLTDTLGVEASEGVEQKYRIETVDSLGEALADRPDAVLVCNPTSLHLGVAQAAADAGCHLFIEKPLADELDGVDRLIATVEQNKLVALVAYQWRFHPLLQRVKQVLDEGALGAIAAVEAHIGEYLPLWHKYEDYRSMYASRRDQGGGVILTQIHEMDYLLWLFGAPSRVVAMGGRRSSLEIDVEDTASILMDIGGVPVTLHQDYLQNPPRRTLQVVGDLGKLVADLLAPRLTVFREGKLVEEATFEGFQRNNMFQDEMRHFLECLGGRATPAVSLPDGAMSLRTALAARESLETGRMVSL